MTNDELQAIRARCEAATAGPWVTDNKNCYVFTLPNDGQKMIAEMRISGGQISNSEQEANTIFCAHARADTPSLLAHIDHQQRALEWLARRSLSYAGESAENFQSICNLAILATKEFASE